MQKTDPEPESPESESSLRDEIRTLRQQFSTVQESSIDQQMIVGYLLTKLSELQRQRAEDRLKLDLLEIHHNALEGRCGSVADFIEKTLSELAGYDVREQAPKPDLKLVKPPSSGEGA